MEANLHLRLPATVKKRIKDAAGIRGQTMTEFVKAAVLDRADEVLRQRDRDAMAEFLAGVPDDDEPYTEEEQQADLEAWARYQEQGGITHEQLGKRFRRAAG